jgi:hypothetical protein
MKIVLTDVDLSVEHRDPAGGENIIFNVTGDRAHFFLYQDMDELVDGVPVWKIFEWRDEKIRARAGSQPFVELKSWGSIKALFNPDAPIPEDPRTTIAGVMQELVDAYETRGLTRYSALFDADQFRFVFDPIDVAENPDIPTSWDWPDDLVSTRTMFASPLVERIQLAFFAGAPVEATEPDERDRPFPEGTMKIVLTDVDLDVDTRDPNGGGNIIFKVTGDRAHFFLYPDMDEIVDGVPVWKIFEWRDEKIGAVPTQESSWGEIKFLWGR